jgi:hypothetical protein
MQEIADEVTVHAPLEQVWKAIQDPGEHVAWHPFATRIDGEHAPGAVRTCTVQIGRKPAATTERCTAYENEAVIMWNVERDSSGFSKMVCDWRTGFTLHPQGLDNTRVRAISVLRPKGPLVRVMMPAIARKFHQTQRAILHALQRHVEH